MYHKQAQDVQENGSIDELIKIVPCVLDAEDKDVQKVGLYYLPFSTGFEIECDQKDNFNTEDFLNIPDIMDVNVDKYEQRYRIPNGIKGLQCLYNISIMLKMNSKLNLGSGIHYHIDCTDFWDDINGDSINLHKDWILNELDSWNYKGVYNKRNINIGGYNWIRFSSEFKTAEFRCGEMTFDYELLFKRISHANSIIRKFKNNITKNLLTIYDNDNIDSVLNNRIKKI